MILSSCLRTDIQKCTVSDVDTGITDISQCTRFLMANYCSKVHNAHFKLVSPFSGSV